MAPVNEDSDDAFPTKQLAVLALCRVSEPIAFTSILAYSFVMVQDLNGSDKDASVYSGLLVSAFAIAETSTIMFWTVMSDRVGRKPIILIGLAGTAISGLIFGFAQKFWVALLARLLGGALNGNVAVMQTMVSEMVKRPEHEPRAYSVQPFMWSLGSIIGTAMGGFLAQPVKYYPSIFAADGLFGRYPYLLPNLVAAIVIFFAIIQAYFLMEETNPMVKQTKKQDRGSSAPAMESIPEHASITERTPLTLTRTISRASGRASVLSRGRRASMLSGTVPPAIENHLDMPIRSSMDSGRPNRLGSTVTMEDEGNDEEEQPSTAITTHIYLLVLAFAIFSFHQMESGTLFPIWLLDDRMADGIDLKGGLDFNVHEVGTFMSINGVVSVIIQGFVFAPFVAWVGVWRTVLSLTIFYPVTYVIVPFLSAVPDKFLSTATVLVIGLQTTVHVLYYPCLLILLKNATPSPLMLGKVNGLAMSAACAARTVAPPLGGVIYAAGGSAAAWWSCSAVTLISIVILYWLRPGEGEDPEENEEETSA